MMPKSFARHYCCLPTCLAAAADISRVIRMPEAGTHISPTPIADDDDAAAAFRRYECYCHDIFATFGARRQAHAASIDFGAIREDTLASAAGRRASRSHALPIRQRATFYSQARAPPIFARLPRYHNA